jgi:hypothetical protein
VCLLVAYLHYQYWDVSLQIAAIPRVQFFVPVPNDQSRPPRPAKAEGVESEKFIGSAAVAYQSAAAPRAHRCA